MASRASWWLSFTLSAVAMLFVACVVVTDDPAGQPCQTREDCRSNLYDCVAPAAEEATICQLIYPPSTSTDAGTGPVTDVFWCNDVDALMNTYCEECHGDDRSGSGNQNFRLDVYEDDTSAMPVIFGAQTKAARIKVRMSDFKDMPPIGYHSMPTDEERARVGQWVQGGARECQDGGM